MYLKLSPVIRIFMQLVCKMQGKYKHVKTRIQAEYLYFIQIFNTKES